MRRIAAGVGLLVSACLHGQTIRDLLLPGPRHFAGRVSDTAGSPVPGARIDHTSDHLHAYQTDAAGRFDVDTRAPAVVIRKAGFQSVWVRTQNAPIRITLQRVSQVRAFPVCSPTGRYEGIEGWGAAFEFLKMAGIKSSKQGRDIDYGVRNYYVKTKRGPKGVLHGSGPLWSFGLPVDRDVWRSVKYEEVTYENGGQPIIDARGEFANGDRWRSLGKFGESASYSDVEPATAKTLDKFLEGSCLRSAPPRAPLPLPPP
jgi:hypothetical protein